MLYLDLPTRDDFTKLADMRADACVSIYLNTTPVTQDTQASRIEMKNLMREAQSQLEAAEFDKRRLANLFEKLNTTLEDDEFWRFQANSLAIFATPDHIKTFRLANQLSPMAQVSDRFHLKPLFRATTFEHSAYILALSENAVRLVKMHADMKVEEVKAQGMPRDAASSVGKSTLNDRSHSNRIVGSEGQNVRFEQYVRQIDAALQPILRDSQIPLVLAATGRLAEVFRQSCSYPHLLPDVISDSPDRISDAELAELARPAVDNAYSQQLAELKGLFEQRTGENRTTTDISDAAKAATFGAVDTLMVDIDAVVPGLVDEKTGAVTFAEADDANTYGVVDEIAARTFANGGTVLGLRREDIPGGGDLAAILRYSG